MQTNPEVRENFVIFQSFISLFYSGQLRSGMTTAYSRNTPMYGSQTPMYGSGSRTPMYGSQTPVHDGK